jgi:hypothetical protein
MTKSTKDKRTSRRRFLQTAAAGAAAAGVAAPAAIAQTGPISMRWQSTWPSKDIFHEYALDYAKKVNDMTGGDLKIEVLPAGAVVPAFGLLDAVSKGVLDGGHGVLVYHYGKQTALALWGSGPGLCDGRQHAAGLAPLRRRQGAARESSMHRSAPTWCRSPTGRCRRSRSAGSRSRSRRPTTSRASNSAPSAFPLTSTRRRALR